MSVTIYHNPNCGTSRNTLAMIRQSGVEPVIVEYLKTPPSREKLKELIPNGRVTSCSILCWRIPF
jgi:arsenate reductase (glutaredoxin)